MHVGPLEQQRLVREEEDVQQGGEDGEDRREDDHEGSLVSLAYPGGMTVTAPPVARRHDVAVARRRARRAGRRVHRRPPRAPVAPAEARDRGLPVRVLPGHARRAAALAPGRRASRWTPPAPARRLALVPDGRDGVVDPRRRRVPRRPRRRRRGSSTACSTATARPPGVHRLLRPARVGDGLPRDRRAPPPAPPAPRRGRHRRRRRDPPDPLHALRRVPVLHARGGRASTRCGRRASR